MIGNPSRSRILLSVIAASVFTAGSCSLKEGAFVVRRSLANGSLDCAKVKAIEAGYEAGKESADEYLLTRRVVEVDFNTKLVYDDFLILRVDSGPPAVLEVYATRGFQRRTQPIDATQPELVQGGALAATEEARAMARTIAGECGKRVITR